MRMAPAVTRTLFLASALCVAAAVVLARSGRSETRAARTARSRPLAAEDVDPPEVQIGERLFLETRFAQYFQAHSGGDVNRTLAVGDAAVATPPTLTDALPGPFTGESMNCRGCHFVDDVNGASVNTYSDYSRRSRVSAREDGGSGALAQQFAGLADRVVLTRTAPSIPPETRLPPEYRIDVATATDQGIFDGVARIIGAYLRSLTYSRDEQGLYNGSPYDVFLAKNGLPRAPEPGESNLDYARRLRVLASALSDPRSQEEYDEANGDGTFARLFVPDLAMRTRRPDDFLPATPQHPHAREIFKAVPSHAQPGAADLGLWNVFANPDFPGPQPSLRRALAPLGDTPESVLPKTLAYFKTPTLRNLGQSAPYLHTGRKRELEEVIDFTIDSARKTRQGRLRNPSPELSDIFLADGDIDPLAAFLRALNEDYN